MEQAREMSRDRTATTRRRDSGTPWLRWCGGMRPGVPVAVVALLALAAACGRGAPPPPPEPVAPVNPMVPLAAGAQLFYDDRGGIPDSVRIVVRDQDAWREQWGRATSQRADPPPLPQVDFEQHMVLVVGAGRKSPGDRIQVDSAGVRTERTTELEEDVFEIIVRTVEGCARIPADVYPLTIVRVPRFEGRVSFVERVERAQCPEAT